MRLSSTTATRLSSTSTTPRTTAGHLGPPRVTAGHFGPPRTTTGRLGPPHATRATAWAILGFARRFRCGNSSRLIYFMCLPCTSYLARTQRPQQGARWRHNAAGRRGHRRLSARCGPTAARAPRTAVSIARSRVSAPWAPVSTGVRHETAERGPRLAEVPRRAESAPGRFSDAPGGVGVPSLLRPWGS